MSGYMFGDRSDWGITWCFECPKCATAMSVVTDAEGKGSAKCAGCKRSFAFKGSFDPKEASDSVELTLFLQDESTPGVKL